MKVDVIRLDSIDDMLDNYLSMKRDGETFREFIECTKDDDEDSDKPFFVWERVEDTNLIKVDEDGDETPKDIVLNVMRSLGELGFTFDNTALNEWIGNKDNCRITIEELDEN